jgi:ubiquinone/menaquinone biosynthesis C-methylase UbiE
MRKFNKKVQGITMKESEHIRLNEIKWDKWAAVADGKGCKYDYLRKAQNHVISISDIKENMNFLDIGCGTGWAVGQAAKMVNNKGTFYGIDLSAKMIDKAKEKFKDKHNVHFIQANSESIPLYDNLFDIIICTNSFHHYLNPVKVMLEIHRLLKTGGKIYILDPIADFWIVKIISKLFKLIEPEHVKIYSSKEFKKLMENAGLKYLGCNRIIKQHKVQIGEK